MKPSIFWEGNCHAATQDTLSFYGIQSFITVFTRARSWSLYWGRWINPATSHPVTLRSIPILSSHLRLSSLSGIFPSFFPN